MLPMIVNVASYAMIRKMKSVYREESIIVLLHQHNHRSIHPMIISVATKYLRNSMSQML